MNAIDTLARDDAAWPPLSSDRPLSIAILAMGGQGGGVLAAWIVSVAEANGWYAQSTSVPGVAQRTGATVYYLELLKQRAGGMRPVLSLMPVAGDVDVIIASELMEAGRSMLRGLVTPDRTLLIASTHRCYAIAEKAMPGDGIGDPTIVTAAADVAAKRTIAFDMAALAQSAGSVISSALFGALAAAQILPFPRAAFEAAIRATDEGVDASLQAFDAAYRKTVTGQKESIARRPLPNLPALPRSAGRPELETLVKRIRVEFPEVVHAMLFAGTKRLVDYQSAGYAHEYLDRICRLLEFDEAGGGAAKGYALTREAAKYVANAMAYDDPIRVADLKTRGSRFRRVREEVGARADQIVYTTEFMHPRMAEVCDTLPAALGAAIERRPRLYRALDRLIDRGRRIRTGTLTWFLVLYALAGLRPLRPSTLRHKREQAHIATWLETVHGCARTNYDLAVEVLKCRRLVKGYSDTRMRGSSTFDRVLSTLPLVAMRSDGADWIRRLRDAALLDEQGEALDRALKTVAALEVIDTAGLASRGRDDPPSLVGDGGLSAPAGM